MTVVEGAVVVVDRVIGIADPIQIVAERGADRLPQNGLVGIFAGAEIFQAHAGQHFKFRVDRAGADGGNAEKSRRVFSRQPREIGQGLAGKGQTGHAVDVEKGLQLDDDDIGVLQHGCRRLRLGFLQVFDDIVDAGVAVAVGPVDPLVKDAFGKAVDEAVFFIGVGQIAEFLRNAAAADAPAAEAGADQTAGGQAGHALHPARPEPGRFDIQKYQQQDAKDGGSRAEGDLPGRHININNIQRRLDVAEIGKAERGDAHTEQHAVDHAAPQPQNGGQQDGEQALGKDGGGQQGHQDHQAAQHKRDRMLQQIGRALQRRVAADALDEQVEQRRQKQAEQQAPLLGHGGQPAGRQSQAPAQIGILGFHGITLLSSD